MRKIIVFFCVFFSLSVSAATITFDDVTPAFAIGEGESGGFNFSTHGAGAFQFAVVLDNIVLDLYAADNLWMEEAAGASFALETLDLGSNGPANILVTGYYAGGGTVQTNLSHPGGYLVPFSFDSSWQNLEMVEFEMPYAWMDNIVVTAVPVPAAVWLFGSALAGLGLLRRKRTV